MLMHTALAKRGIRFALTGAAVTLLYLLVTTGLHDALGVPFQVALLCGFATAVAAHFTLQRTFVWTHPDGYALSAHHQAGRYLAVAALQYSATAAATALLPGPLGVRVTFIYLATTVIITVVNFLVFRARIFHPRLNST
jgi:putative flippase GtrA